MSLVSVTPEELDSVVPELEVGAWDELVVGAGELGSEELVVPGGVDVAVGGVGCPCDLVLEDVDERGAFDDEADLDSERDVSDREDVDVGVSYDPEFSPWELVSEVE